MKNKSIHILLGIAITVGVFNIIWVIPYVFRSFDLNNFSSLFNNFITPIATIAAFVIYYLTLNHIKQQTESLNEQNQLVIGEKIFEEFSNNLNEFKTKHQKLYLHTEFKNISPRSCISLIDIDFKNEFEILLNEPNYIRFKEGNIDKKEYCKCHEFRQYKVSNVMWGKLNSFIYDVEFFIDKIENSNELHSSHKRRLVNLICSEIIKGYLNFAGEKLAYDIYLLTPANGQSTYFEALKIARLSERIQKDYNEIYLENYSLT